MDDDGSDANANDRFGANDNIEYHNNKDSDTDPGIEKLQQELATAENEFNNTKSTHNMKLHQHRTPCYSSYVDPSFSDDAYQLFQ